MGAQIVFDLTPRRVPRVQTKYRRIVTDIPAPKSVPVSGAAAAVRAALDERPAPDCVGSGRRYPGL